jgi:tetratricopeptide (TPR) repeat protein
MKRILFWLAIALFLGRSSIALAQRSSTDVALAEELYREARSLMDEKRYDEACKKFAESQRLDPATGTLLNLAACHEAMGLTATAWVEYGEALLAARRDQRPDRVQYAEERIRGVEPKLSRLAILVPPESRIEGLEVRIDGALIGAAAWGVSAPIDPGPHKVAATAAGRKPWSAEVTIGAEADKQTIQVPLLEIDPNVPAPGAQAQPSGTAGGPSAQTPPTADELALERPIPPAVYVAGGVTLALAAAAGISGAIYLSKKSDYKEANLDPRVSPDQRQELKDSAELPGVVNAVTTGAAIAGAVLTGVLYFTRPERPVAGRVRVAPWMTANGGGIAVGGAL